MHTCARLQTGQVKCWGQNGFGELGVGDANNRGTTPAEMGDNLPAVDLGPGRTATKIFAGTRVSCAILDDGNTKCWGANTNGELGLGDNVSRGTLPADMGVNLPSIDFGARKATQLELASQYGCALLDDASVKCWGTNTVGQLGLGDRTPRGSAPGQMGANLPVVSLGGNAVELSARYSHACARLDNGSLKCWGDNVFGVLGLGDTNERGSGTNEMGASLPGLDFGAGRTVVRVGAGFEHSCARLDNSAIKCWGRNEDGFLGIGDKTNRGLAPLQMGDSLPAIALE